MTTRRVGGITQSLLQTTMSCDQVSFIRCRCSIDVSFWSALTEKILNEWKDSIQDKDVHGFYQFNREKCPRICLSANSLSSEPPQKFFACWPLPGTLKILANEKSWQCFDALGTLNECAEKIWLDIENERFLSNPQLLSRFVIVVYPDIKKYKYHYWFGLPAITPKLKSRRLSSDLFPTHGITSSQIFKTKGFFAIHTDASRNVVHLLELSAVRSPDDIIFAMVDPTSEEKAPSWLLRNFITAVVSKFGSNRFAFTCIKSPDVARIEKIIVNDVLISTPRPIPTGWEININGKAGPRLVDLSSAMNPEKLSTSSVNLNLRLMKWREFPGLDLNMLNRLKVLILGAGTLGCDVARNLASWGICHFTFIDNGNVAFSNPTRQSLYNFEDCLTGKKKKAVAAAEAMKRISPSINAIGYVSTITMVGHPLGPDSVQDAEKDFDLLEKCIDDADIVFLLTDSRESRWLPTVICAAKNKPLMNCALGFDTFVVIRHGTEVGSGRERLGCYFCADISAPGDSVSDRTLDKQCTVTRPGVGSIASALSVELAVNWLHNVEAEATPSSANFSMFYNRAESLGIVPHQIRGWLAQFHIAAIKGVAYVHCIACSETIVNCYKTEGWNFIQRVVNDPVQLEELCGISELKTEVDQIDWEIDEFSC